jgi:outer membrane lipoprotein-sorting protein
MAKLQSINKVVRKHYADVNGTLVEVRGTASPDQYGKGVIVYENTLAKGAKAGQKEYWVSPEDFIPAKRTSTKESVQNMLASGLTAEEIVAKLSA